MHQRDDSAAMWRAVSCPQELGLVNEWVSETIFTTLFVSFMTWTFSPFCTSRKRFYTAVIWSRLLMVLVGEWELPQRLCGSR